MIVSTATAVNENSPRPGSTVASSPSFTSATSTDITNTSSIAHGPMSSSIRNIHSRWRREAV